MPGDKFYHSRDWFKARSQRLKADGYRCFVPGCNVRASIVDHIVERSAGGAPYDQSNLRSCCPAHHNQAHREKARGGGPRDARFVVKGCDADGWPLAPERR